MDVMHGCNALGRYSEGPLLPMRQDGERFFNADGLLITKPDSWHAATAEEIRAELQRQGAQPVSLRSLCR